MNIANTAPTQPSHRLYAVTRKPGSDKGFWTAIGAAWAHRDGKGFAIRLELLPVNGAEIVLRLIEEKKDETEGETSAEAEA